MGLPMARNLLKAGHTVVGFNRSPEKVERFAADGGSGAGSIAEAVDGAEVVVTMLPDSPDVLAVYTGDQGILTSAAPGTLLIDASTIRPDVTVDLHHRATESGFRFLDAPVSGGEQGAVDGSLSIMCGGEQETFDAARAVLEAVGKTIVLVGGPGSGQTVKAANQLLVAGTIQLVAEALVFLDAHEVDLAPALEVLNGGLAGNTIMTRKGQSMLDGQFAPGFRVDLHHKDLGIYREAARDQGVFSPLGTAVTELMAALRRTGGGDLDHSALLQQVDALSGRSRWADR
ncbi:2-hydroxy-3-oxopropionate reductase [Microlunatus endophyticus]|uniref:2-hydroxy-3-oxopropionate reductase n=2 Tax=Microlunatus endophyticus TaxID=1716077 RepID=A0A917SDJ4_9ACTN|nr:2-hydroxy-3-oxopropionate reductase [Microlunatus endophyticus]